MWGRHMSGERGVWARGRIEASATHHRVYSSENNMIVTHIRGTQTSDVDLRTHEKKVYEKTKFTENGKSSHNWLA